MNHAVLYVRNVERTVAFYTELLGFTVKATFPGAAFLRAPASTNDHDLGLFEIGSGAGPSTAGRSTVGLYHLAWEVETLDELAALREKLGRAGFLVGQSDHGTTKSLYVHDPDGLEFEIAWLVPAEQITDEMRQVRTQRLDLEATIDHYGGGTIGGVGVTRPATV